jgi:hypothetical protein
MEVSSSIPMVPAASVSSGYVDVDTDDEGIIPGIVRECEPA